MATRNINTFIEHLMNENMAATQAAVTAGTAVKQKKREQRDDVLRSALGVEVGGIARDTYKHLMPKTGDAVDIASPVRGLSGLNPIPGIGAKSTVDKLKAKSPAAEKESTDSGPYGELNKAGGLDRHRDRHRDRMKKSTPSGSAGGY